MKKVLKSWPSMMMREGEREREWDDDEVEEGKLVYKWRNINGTHSQVLYYDIKQVHNYANYYTPANNKMTIMLLF